MSAEATVLDLAFDVSVGVHSMRCRLDTAHHAVAIVGPSGAGKSTILRVLAGVETRATGRVAVGGRVWLDSSSGTFVSPWERGVGWVPQETLLFPHLSVAGNLGYAGAAPDRVEEISELLEISALLDRRPRRLSGGERQRVALGRALLSEPSLLLLDEPFSALDRALRRQLAGVVGEWASRRGVPLVLVSHDEADADTLAVERWRLTAGVLNRE